MSCYKSATAVIHSGTTGYVLVVQVEVFSGIVPATLNKGNPPFNPENVLPVTIIRSVPSSPTLSKLEVTHNLKSQDEITSVEIFCGDQKPGTIIAVTKK